ncbi:Peptidyl-prolyl cis-trans isomerase pin4 [Elasticomyces elasticus]|nr:Peptidyl-prolyl cis-trans isomerase pin4 [Elasticomyces elasticus]
MYYETPTTRSSATQRHQPQTLHRQPSRHFDAYGHLPSGLYTAEDHAARYDSPRYNDRMNATIHGGYGQYDLGQQAWNGTAFGPNNTLTALGATNRMKSGSRGRSALPAAWMDQPQPLPTINGPFVGLGSAALDSSPMRTETLSQEDLDDLIPTAIVIKNIPFAVKKEQLVQLMTDLNLPLPYAFNYHFDNGVFRGLAFANFTTADETAAVIHAMNHLELQGRKLRVEYKKMLPAAERERIEREKRERRGQLEEQHRPIVTSSLQSQASMSSLSSHIPATSPSPVSARNTKPDVDLNDPQALQYFSQLLLFKEDKSREVLVFPPTLPPQQRRVVHTLAHHMGLAHLSKGQADQRAVHVYREQPRQRLSPPMQNLSADSQRRALNRAATTDFSDVRDTFYNGLRHQASGYLGGYHDSSGGLTAGQNLRAAKSFADLRSYTPSPVPSTASFPATLGTNISRFADYGRDGATSTTPTLPPAGSTMTTRDETLMVNGLGSLNLNGGFGGSPRGLRNMMSWENNPGPIGGHRSFSSNYDEQSRDRAPARQPRGPPPERSGFGSRGRQNGHLNRGSDELSQQSNGPEITVEH